MHTPCQCKDYFQDLFWAEHTGKSVSVYGFVWVPPRVNTDAKRFVMALSYPHIEAQQGALQRFLNVFDASLGFCKTRIQRTDSHAVLRMTFSGQWTRSAPLMSAFTTLVRLGYTYTEGVPVLEYLDRLQEEGAAFLRTFVWPEGVRSRINNGDIQRLNRTLPRLRQLLRGHIPTHSYSSLASGLNAHGCGILGSPESAWK